MSVEVNRGALQLLEAIANNPQLAQELHRALRKSYPRQRQNDALVRKGEPQAVDDINLVAIDGATTLKKGDENSSPRSIQLTRPPLISEQGGRNTIVVTRQEQDIHDYLAVVVSQNSPTSYQCKLLSKEPQTKEEARTKQPIPKGQTDVNDDAITDVGTTPESEQVEVFVYGDTANFNYSAGNVIEVKVTRIYEVMTAYIKRKADRASRAVVTKTLKEEKFWHTRYENNPEGGG